MAVNNAAEFERDIEEEASVVVRRCDDLTICERVAPERCVEDTCNWIIEPCEVAAGSISGNSCCFCWPAS